MNSSKSKTDLFSFMKAQVSAEKQFSKRQSGILSAHCYVSPRGHSLSHKQSEIRRIAYALKIPTHEACETAGRAMAPLLIAAEAAKTPIVLIPVPTSTGSIEPNRQLANEIAAEIQRRQPARRIQVQIMVGRKHPVESSCVRRKRGARGLRADQHAMIRVANPTDIGNTAFYLVDNVATTGTTIFACRAALGFGRGIVWADKQKP